MKCKELRDMLSAYADREVTEEQKKTIEEHLETCTACRDKLAEYNETGKQIVSLKQTSVSADIRTATMNRINILNAGTKRVWLQAGKIAVPVLLILAIVLPLSFTGGASAVLAKAYSAIENVETFRVNGHHYVLFPDTNESELTTYSEETFGKNDSVYIKVFPWGAGLFSERILINDVLYTKGTYRFGVTSQTYTEALTPTREKTLNYLEMIADVKTLEDATIEGIDCHHYKGLIDIDKWVEKSLAESRKRFEDYWFEIDIEPIIESLEKYWRSQEIEYELWIGKDDYLIRRMKEHIRTIPDGLYETVIEITYYDFNADIIIEPPLTETGELEEGWRKLDTNSVFRLK